VSPRSTRQRIEDIRVWAAAVVHDAVDEPLSALVTWCNAYDRGGKRISPQ
jgi:hypothetical protein